MPRGWALCSPMLALNQAPSAPRLGWRARPPRPRPASRAFPDLSQLLGAEGSDPGDWRHSPEWWGTQDGGWGRSPGETVFVRRSDAGNGKVTVTSHEASEVLKSTEDGRPEGSYQEWRVLRFNDNTRQGVARVMVTSQLDGSPLCEAQPDCLAFEYLKTMASAGAAILGNMLPKGVKEGSDVLDYVKGWRMLVVGGGAFSLPQFLQHHFPLATVEAVELDPVVVQAATEHMGVPKTSAWSLVQGEGANYLRECCRTGSCWDIIFIDAFDGNDKIPDVLCSSDGLSTLSQALHPRHGAIVVNTHGGIISGGYSFLGALPFLQDCGFDPGDPMGRRVAALCSALRSQALGDGGTCITISTVHQDNIVVIASRGLSLQGDGMAAKSTMEALASTVASAAKFPFSASSRASRNLTIWR